MKLNVTERIHGAILCCYPSLKAEKYTDFIFCSRISDQFLRVIQLLPIHKKGSSSFRKSLRCESNFLWNGKKLKFPFPCLRKKRVILIWQLCPSLVKKKIIIDLFSNTYFELYWNRCSYAFSTGHVPKLRLSFFSKLENVRLLT